MTERLKVEEWHEQKLAEASAQGWRPRTIADQYAPMRREKWLSLAETSGVKGKQAGMGAKLTTEEASSVYVTTLRGGISEAQEDTCQNDKGKLPYGSVRTSIRLDWNTCFLPIFYDFPRIFLSTSA
jgi:hypothetical protein